MYEWMWLIGLCLLLFVLFLLALLKPALHKPTKTPIDPHTQNSDALILKSQLAAHLPDYTMAVRSSRLLISRDGTQIAIITLDDHAVMRERWMDEVLILSLPTRYASAQLHKISEQVRHHAAKLGMN